MIKQYLLGKAVRCCGRLPQAHLIRPHRYQSFSISTRRLIYFAKLRIKERYWTPAKELTDLESPFNCYNFYFSIHGPVCASVVLVAAERRL